MTYALDTNIISYFLQGNDVSIHTMYRIKKREK